MSDDVQQERERILDLVMAMGGHAQAVVLKRVLHGIQQGLTREQLAAKWGPPFSIVNRDCYVDDA